MSIKWLSSVVLMVGLMLLAPAVGPIHGGDIPLEALTPDLAPSTYLLGPELQLSPGGQGDRRSPAIAYNYRHREYLVAWHNVWGGSRDIYARRVSASGQILSWFCVTTGAADRVAPAVAYNAADDQYLIVWMQEASPDVYEIWGKVIPWNGPGSGTEFRIIQWANRSFWNPQVAWNSYRNEYLVAWNAFNTAIGFPPGVPNDIAGHRVSASGAVLTSLPLSLTTYSGPHQVDLVYNVAVDEYFLVFVVVHTQATAGNDIYGLRVRWDGQPINPPGLIQISREVNDQNAPAVATNEQNRYMVVWEDEYSGTDGDIYGREYAADGNPVSSRFTIASWTEDDRAPDVAANGAHNEWLAVWQRTMPMGSGYSIHGFRWGSGPGTTYTYSFDVANWTYIECKNPAAAADNPGYLIAYEEMAPPAPFHIYARRWVPEVVFMPVAHRNY